VSEHLIHAVTGAFGYSGKYIAQRLLDKGCEVVTLTNSPDRADPFGGRVRAYPFNFDNSAALAESLSGVEVLYNTYWVRFNHKAFSQADAVRNTEVLFRAARDAGVERVVHISITNPSLDSPLEYFRSKARLEEALIATGVSHAILRPAVLFGGEDILVNNIAWTLRHLPVFGVFGDGNYRLQPIHVEDLADLAVEQGRLRENVVINAIGPETFSYRELVERIGDIIGKRRPVLGVPPVLGFAAAWAVGKLMRDTLLTMDEVRGLMGDLLYVDAPPSGKTKLTEWARDHSVSLGTRYASELARRLSRQTPG
jgi:NADH dehydrogenase